MNIDVTSLAKTMIDGARRSAGERWPAIRHLAEPELRKLAQTLEDVRQLYAGGAIAADRAFELVEMQRNTALSVVRTVNGLGILAARDAVAAAVRAAGPAVNRLIGFELIKPTKPPTGRTAVKAEFKAGKDL
jgi:hypothetical protein